METVQLTYADYNKAISSKIAKKHAQRVNGVLRGGWQVGRYFYYVGSVSQGCLKTNLIKSDKNI